MEFLVILCLIVVGVVILIMMLVSRDLKRQQAMEEKIVSLENFDADQKIIGSDFKSGLAIDENRKKICLINRHGETLKCNIIAYKDVLSSEIFEDNNTITSSSRTSQLGGALVGGLALGGAGAIIGGLSGKKVSSNKVKRIDLRLTINRTDSPVHDINFMRIEAQKDGIVYKSAMEKVRHWHGLLDVIIHRSNK